MYEQDRVFVRLQQRVLQDRDIQVCFVTGSYGRRVQDAFSDLDVALVYASDQARQRAFGQRRQFVRSVMPYVPAKSFDADHIRPFFHIALYSNGSKVDFRFDSMESLVPSPWDRDLRILKDDRGWAEQYQNQCASLPFPQSIITAAELLALDERFWVMFWDTFRQVQRGDVDKPFPVYIQLFTMTLLPLIDMLPQEDSARSVLLRAHFNHDTRATLSHLRQLLANYLQARAALVQRYDLLFNADSRFEQSVRRLVEKG